MSPSLVAPLALVALALLGGRALHRVASPRVLTWAASAVLVTAAAGLSAALVLLVAAGASELGHVGSLHLSAGGSSEHHGSAPVVGAAAALALALAALGAGRRARRVVAESRSFGEVGGMAVVADRGALAVAVPGRSGGIVLSGDLVASARPEDLAAVVAHEQAHLALGHHRFVRVAEVVAAGFPVLRPMAAAVRYGTERWADEVAAEAVGSRSAVAAAIARVALMGHPAGRSEGLTFVERATTLRRVRALLEPPAAVRLAGVPVLVAVVASIVGSSVQLHHLVEFSRHTCLDCHP